MHYLVNIFIVPFTCYRHETGFIIFTLKNPSKKKKTSYLRIEIILTCNIIMPGYIIVRNCNIVTISFTEAVKHRYKKIDDRAIETTIIDWFRRATDCLKKQEKNV